MDDYEDLPDNDYLAFIKLEQEFRMEFESELTSRNGSFEYEAANYANRVLAAAAQLNISQINDYPLDLDDSPNFAKEFNKFKRAVDHIIIQIRILNSRGFKEQSVGLSSDQKTKLHVYIEKIRSEIDASDAEISKKEKIFSILSKLMEEISKERTSFSRFGDLARGLAGISRDVEQVGARPWWKWFVSMMGIIDIAKDNEPQLPRPPEMKRLSPPKAIPSSEGKTE